ncbi:MAG TPA: Dabb family protein [Mycobacterium sp.]
MRHVVLWKWQPHTSPEDVRLVLEGLTRLAGVVPGLRAVQCGVNASRSTAARGNTHYSILTFDDAGAFAAWHDDANYQAWSATARPIIEKPTVLDIDGDADL